MGKFYIIEDIESGQFLTETKTYFWDGYFDIDKEIYVDCFRFKTKKEAEQARAKAVKQLKKEFPEDPEEAFVLRIYEVTEKTVKIVVHESVEL